METKFNTLLNSYLEYKLGLKPANHKHVVTWDLEDCPECGNNSFSLKINGFEPGITVHSMEILTWMLENGVYFEDEKIKFV